MVQGSRSFVLGCAGALLLLAGSPLMGAATPAEVLLLSGRPGPKEPRPASPGSVAVTGVSGLVVTLQWSDLSTNETGFRIEHQVRSGSTWSGAGTYSVGANRDTADITVAAGRHRFRVAAVGTGGNSRWTSWSAAVEVAGEPAPPPPEPLPPSAPENLVVVPVDGASTVLLRWDDTSSDERGFNVERNPPFADGTRTVGANVSSLEDAVGAGTYQYRVRSFNDAGASAYTPWVQYVVTSSPPNAPGSPGARDMGNGRDIAVTWTDNSTNEESFVIERQRQVGSFWGEDVQLSAPADATSIIDAAGLGTFRYRIAAVNTVGQSLFTAWAAATATVSDGWTQFTPSADTRIVYVSSSQGNDSNDGLSADRPKRTIPAAYAVLRHGYPDWMMLKRGDVWDESLGHWRKSGRSATERMVISSYGPASARPLLRTGTGNGFTRQGGGGSPSSIDYLAIVGLHFVPHLRTTESPTGIYWLDAGRDLLIEDCKFERYGNNITLQGYTGRIERVAVRRCIVVDAYDIGDHSQGMFASAIDGLLIEENFFDHNGWHETIEGAEPTIFNHNLYLATTNTNVVVRDNIIARGSSHGVQLRSGGDLIGNVSIRNAVGLLLGGGTTHASTHTYGVTGNVIDNVILEGTDISPTLRRGFGIDVTNIGLLGAQVRNNVIAHKHTAYGASAIMLAGSGAGSGVGCNNVVVSDNLVYDWRGPVWITPPPSTPPSPSTFASVTGIEINSNIFQEPDDSVAGPIVRIFGPEACTLRASTYSSARALSNWFEIGTQAMSYTTWVTRADDRESHVDTMTFPDPDRSIAGYAQVVGVGSTLEDFLNAAEGQSRQSWRTDLTADAVRAYIREGFGLASQGGN